MGQQGVRIESDRGEQLHQLGFPDISSGFGGLQRRSWQAKQTPDKHTVLQPDFQLVHGCLLSAGMVTSLASEQTEALRCNSPSVVSE